MIHPSAIIDPSAKIHESVEVGPYSLIGPNVEIDEGCWIGPHVIIRRDTTIGKNNQIFQFTSIGEDPQDKKYAGEPTRLVIGDNNVIRESTTIHRGTAQDKGVTIIGNNNLIMGFVHIAHDCVLKDNIIMANAATIGGHVEVGDWAIMGGFAGAHQFCKIGAHAFVSMQAGVHKDVPPYVTAAGQPAVPKGINVEGLKRRQFSDEAILEIKRAYKVLYRQKLTANKALEQLEATAKTRPEIQVLVDFVAQATRGIIR